MAVADHVSTLNDPVTRHLRTDVTRLRLDQSVGGALAWLRGHPPEGPIVYFYVVDADGRLQGVVPTRRLVLSPPEAPLADIMIGKVVALPADATVMEACEFFIQHRFLAIPVVDDDRRLLGVVDVALYTDELLRLGEAAPVDRWLRPLRRFLRVESAGSILLLACTVAALVVANSPWSGAYAAFWQTPMGVTLGGVGLTKPLLLWVNDGLMTLFFFVAGLEIKRELVSGELAEPRKALLPVVAALGGMIAPAVVYLLVLGVWGRPGVEGWGVPMATDIAFVVGILGLLGKRIPHPLTVLLLTLAIADDIGATLVIALVYSSDLSPAALAVGVGGFGLVLAFQQIGVRRVTAYVALGVLIWVAFVKSGIHPTVAGVALGLLTPARPWLGQRVPLDVVTELLTRSDEHWGRRGGARRREPVSPVERLEIVLHPWVAFLIMPVFALANAGVPIEAAALGRPIALAVAAGLVLGKPAGIVLFSWASARAGLTRLPAGVTGKVLIGAGCLAGIGFTMSLFVAGLAFQGPHLAEAKVGILVGSAVSALGSLLLILLLPQPPSSASRN